MTSADSTPTADVSVRPARASDAAAVAEVQLAAWRTCYAPVLPPGALDGLHEADAEARWRDAVTAPPSARYTLLVATDGGRLAGFLAAGPGSDDDADAVSGEIYELILDPGYQGRGHGSRLLAAGAEHLTDVGCRRAVVWLFDADEPQQQFFTSAGWAEDGSTRTLDMGSPVGQRRLHTALDDSPSGSPAAPQG